MNNIFIPDKIVKNFSRTPDGAAWLEQLPDSINALKHQWSLELGQPFEEEASCSWVAPCMREDGTSVILKLGWPHMEAAHEIEGLLFWDGDPTVFVLEVDRERNAMLLEQCHPGTTLRKLPEDEQDQVIAKLLQRLWRIPSSAHPFRPLSEMAASWGEETLQKADHWPDKGLTEEGLRLFAELPHHASEAVLLATDLHAGNVLRAERAPWLVIDPKPFIGDPAYDATQHLLNCRERLYADPKRTIQRFSDLLDLDQERVQLWTFARLAIEAEPEAQAIAKRLMAVSD